VNLLYLYGHMHDWGERFHIDIARDGNAPERVYEVEQWQAQFRDAAPLNDYGSEAFAVAADDVVTTSCTWTNDRDDPLGFPQEMCVSLGMLYPSRDPVLCTVLRE
jgi:hypothetical protein